MSKTKTEPTLKQRFYSVKDAAVYLGISEQHIYNSTAKKSKKTFPIPFRRIGGKLLFDFRDLEKF
ncbi:MAG: helix-turn-helix domain-containing protein [Syntrophus sp. (in: bacteria)]